jgi:hypothetical protein
MRLGLGAAPGPEALLAGGPQAPAASLLAGGPTPAPMPSYEPPASPPGALLVPPAPTVKGGREWLWIGLFVLVLVISGAAGYFLIFLR